MGMFHYVKCERVLPDGYDGKGKSFQSKDFECDCQSTYEINNKNELMAECWNYVSGEAVELLHTYKMDYTGDLFFYDIDDKDNSWHEYRAEFVNGNMKELMHWRTGDKQVFEDPKDESGKGEIN